MKDRECKFYYILDSRVIEFLDKYDKDPNYVIPNFEKYIMEADTDPGLLCREINDGTYGDLCVLADNTGRIMFECCKGDKWSIKQSIKQRKL